MSRPSAEWSCWRCCGSWLLLPGATLEGGSKSDAAEDVDGKPAAAAAVADAAREEEGSLVLAVVAELPALAPPPAPEPAADAGGSSLHKCAILRLTQRVHGLLASQDMCDLRQKRHAGQQQGQAIVVSQERRARSPSATLFLRCRLGLGCPSWSSLPWFGCCLAPLIVPKLCCCCSD